MSAREILIGTMKDAVPERSSDIQSLWERYNPAVEVVEKPTRITLDADKDRIRFDPKTMEVFWLIGFFGWKAIETYLPAIIASIRSGQAIKFVLSQDKGLDAVERLYKERRATAQTLIDAIDPASVLWPPDIPRPGTDRSRLEDSQFRAAFDLTGSATAFTFFHEFRHVMLDRDNERPSDLREEELACDVWAREYMTSKIAEYAKAKGLEYQAVTRRRAMAFSLAALILHEITPAWDHGGNEQYFSVATRMEAILDSTPLPDTDSFWKFTASILVGILRQSNIPFDPPTMNAQELTKHLIRLL